MSMILAGVPFGNPGDASPRLRAALNSADIVVAENIGEVVRFAEEIGASIRGDVISCEEVSDNYQYDVTSSEKDGELSPLVSGPRSLAAALRAGATVVLTVGPTGSGVGEPALGILKAAIDAGVPVTSIPGPSMITTALAVSGIPYDRFCFEGYPPRDQGQRRVMLAGIATEARTLVFLETPARIASTLEDCAAAFGGDRPAALCQRLARQGEEVLRAPLADLAARAGERPQLIGDDAPVALVVKGARPVALVAPAEADLAAAVEELVIDGIRRKAAIAAVAARVGLPKRAVYDAVIRQRPAG